MTMRRLFLLLGTGLLVLVAAALYAQFTGDRPGIRTNVAPAWTTNRPAFRLVERWPAPVLDWVVLTRIVGGSDTNTMRVDTRLFAPDPAELGPGGYYELQITPTTNSGWFDIGRQPLAGLQANPVYVTVTNYAWPLGDDPRPFRSRIRFVRGPFTSAWSLAVTNQ
jgi:hypothetical protein